MTMHTVRGPITSQRTHHTKVTKDDIFFHEEFLLDFSNTQPRTEDIPKLLFLDIIVAPYVPRPPLVINCLDDKPWFPIGTRGQGYCVIALFLCRARHIVNTPSPQTLRCTVDKFSKTDKHQLGHTCNVLITSVQVFFGHCKPGVPT